MKRSYATMMGEEESAESGSTAVTNTNQVYLDENPALLPSINNENNEGSNSESEEDGLSDSDKKLRKKRNAYQKISDDIRVNLLESVKNGETLKSAAKRYKINYSSAKSILHTYRKEGRILKKSAQERTTKKKAGYEVNKTQPKTSKSKKENADADENREVITKKVKTQSYANNGEQVQPLGQTNKNRANIPQNDFNDGNTKNALAPISKNDHHIYNDHTQDHSFMGGLNSRAGSRKGSMNFNFHGFNDMGFPDFSHMIDSNSFDFMNSRRFSQDFTSLNDMGAPHAKLGQNDEHFHDPNTFFNKGYQSHADDHKNASGKVENLLDFDDHGDKKGLMDPQRMFRNTLRKASFLSFGSNSGFRKGSFDLF